MYDADLEKGSYSALEICDITKAGRTCCILALSTYQVLQQQIKDCGKEEGKWCCKLIAQYSYQGIFRP